MTTPAALRAEGQEQATAAADFRVVAMIDLAIARANRTRAEWSANDIRDQFPTVRNGLVGARVDAARKRGEMTHVAFIRSSLPSTRGAWIKVWRGAL